MRKHAVVPSFHLQLRRSTLLCQVFIYSYGDRLYCAQFSFTVTEVDFTGAFKYAVFTIRHVLFRPTTLYSVQSIGMGATYHCVWCSKRWKFAPRAETTRRLHRGNARSADRTARPPQTWKRCPTTCSCCRTSARRCGRRVSRGTMTALPPFRKNTKGTWLSLVWHNLLFFCSVTN